MTLDQLRAFAALAQTRNFARAAARLHITQPALTKRIKALELTWDATLFDRSGGSSTLSAIGDILLADAERILAEADALVGRAWGAAKGERGRLDVGFGLSTVDIAPRIVALFRARYPNVVVTLNDFASADQVDRLSSGELDVGFVRLPVPDTLMLRPLLEERLALAGPAAWPGFDGDLQDLNARGFVMLARHRGPGLADQISGWCAEIGFTPRVVQVADDIQTVLALVAAGIGYGLVPERSGRLAASTLCLWPLPGDAARWRVGAAWRRGQRSPVLANFLAILCSDPEAPVLAAD